MRLPEPPATAYIWEEVTKRNAKVVWWMASDGGPKRHVLGRREPVAAWRLFFRLRAMGHCVAGPELWIGNKLVLASGNTEKGLVLPLRA